MGVKGDTSHYPHRLTQRITSLTIRNRGLIASGIVEALLIHTNDQGADFKKM